MSTSTALLGLVDRLQNLELRAASTVIELALKLGSLTDINVFILVETPEGRLFSGKDYLCDAFLASHLWPRQEDVQLEVDPAISAVKTKLERRNGERNDAAAAAPPMAAASASNEGMFSHHHFAYSQSRSRISHNLGLDLDSPPLETTNRLSASGGGGGNGNRKRSSLETNVASSSSSPNKSARITPTDVISSSSSSSRFLPPLPPSSTTAVGNESSESRLSKSVEWTDDAEDDDDDIAEIIEEKFLLPHFPSSQHQQQQQKQQQQHLHQHLTPYQNNNNNHQHHNGDTTLAVTTKSEYIDGDDDDDDGLEILASDENYASFANNFHHHHRRRRRSLIPSAHRRHDDDDDDDEGRVDAIVSAVNSIVSSMKLDAFKLTAGENISCRGSVENRLASSVAYDAGKALADLSPPPEQLDDANAAKIFFNKHFEAWISQFSHLQNHLKTMVPNGKPELGQTFTLLALLKMTARAAFKQKLRRKRKTDNDS